MLAFPVVIVSDCGGQAKTRMAARFASIARNAHCITCEASSLVEAAGDIVDHLDALQLCQGAVVSNSAPRKDTRHTNGSTIVYGKVGGTFVVATAGTLGLLKKVTPNFTARAIDVDAFMKQFVKTDRIIFNFRGLEVIPYIVLELVGGKDLTKVSAPYDEFPLVEPCVWLVDTIEGKPTNLKLSILRDEADWFKPGKSVAVTLGSPPIHELQCYERLTHIPVGQAGIYESSSGLGKRRFLEIAVMGGSAADRFEVYTSGTLISVQPAH